MVNRMHVSREYACSVIVPVFQEHSRQTRALSRGYRRLLVRNPALLNDQARAKLQGILAASQELKAVYELRERLRLLWSSENLSNDHLLQHFRDWLTQAEGSGIQSLRDFAMTLRGYAWKPGASVLESVDNAAAI